MMIKASYSGLEMEILKRNLQYMNKQNQILLKEWVRKDKIDLNLGEVIKGFYADPLLD